MLAVPDPEDDKPDRPAQLMALVLLLASEGPVILPEGAPAEPGLRELISIRADFSELRGPGTEILWTTKDALVLARGSDVVVAVNRGDTALKMEKGWTLQFATDDEPEGILPARSARIYTRTGP
jgi:hypothetical protein